ncbi:MAG: alpha-amylase family glycosyl hydrolase [Kibdelosporangium sp.]
MTWWREAVGYHVYPRSYADSNGDGIGDLPGLLDRLEHPRDLGADAVWISPFYPSPQADFGYDIADHRGVDPASGELSDVDNLVRGARRLGLRLLVDVVPNHTSAAHPWFQAALTGGPERARYHFRPEPNGWESVFGGPAWTRVADGAYYLHLFAAQQPDLNWTNPEVAEDFDATLRFWLDRGFAGIRIDVAGGLAKHPEYASDSTPHPYWDRPETAALHRRWRQLLDSYPGDRVSIGELWGPPDRVAQRVRSGQLHQVFQFDWVDVPWSAEALRGKADGALTELGKVDALPTWLLGSHDLPRVASRYGLRQARAKALVTFALPGAAWIYQGEELGLPDVDLPAGVRTDPGGRDGIRVPMPWSDGPSLGFSTGGRAWLPQPLDWAELSVAAQRDDPDSTLTLYEQAIALRKTYLVGEPFEWLPERPGVLAFRRGEVVCVLNTGQQAVKQPGTPLITSAPLQDGVVAPDSAVWVTNET